MKNLTKKGTAIKKILENIKREIDIEKSKLIDLKKEPNFYRRRIRHLEKKIADYQKCVPAEENCEN